MGRDKAWLPFGPETLLQRMVRIVGEVASPLLVAARPDQELPHLPPEVRAVHDPVENAGPLAGLLAGLAALESVCPAVMVAACDHPLLTPVFLRRLIGAWDPSLPGVIVVHEDRSYPLLGVYRTSLRAELERRLSAGERRAEAFAHAGGLRRVPARELLPDAREIDRVLLNLNDGDAYDRALRLAEAVEP